MLLKNSFQLSVTNIAKTITKGEKNKRTIRRNKYMGYVITNLIILKLFTNLPFN